jgi:hypothetical protein
MQPTAEQQAIVDFVPVAHARVLINAYAGTGKTTTCRQIVERHGLHEVWDGTTRKRSAAGAGHRFLYLAFNKAIQVDAEAKMRGLQLVDCRTAHALAYEYVKSRVPNFSVGELRTMSAGARKLLRDWFLGDRAALPPLPPPAQRQLVSGADYLAEAHDAWARMCSGAAPFSHDAYVKYFCTDAPAVDWLVDRYDSIILDEAQDTSVVLLELLLRLPHCLYLVGDQNQAIYAFRNASNALRRVAALPAAPPQQLRRYALTESFRFGAALAAKANALLLRFALDAAQLRGSAARTTVVARGEPDWSRRWAAIGRSNSRVFAHAVQLAEHGRTLSFVCRDPNAVPVLETIGAALNKYAIGGRLRPELERDLEAAKVAEDVETVRTLKLLKRRGPHAVAASLRQVRAATRVPAKAECLIGTVHGHKGLEWEDVYLIDDFANLDKIEYDLDEYCRRNRLLPTDPSCAALIEEVHLVYVAITRAKSTLLLSGRLAAFLLAE